MSLLGRGRIVANMVQRRLLCDGKKKLPKQRREKLTKEEVEEIAERARAEQRIWDAESKLFGGHIGLGHPMLWVLAFGVIFLHYSNARRDEEREKGAAHFELLRRVTESKKVNDPDSVLRHKKRQLDLWNARDGKEARERVIKLQAEIADLTDN